MNTLDMVKAAKSATGDFANFWKSFVHFAQNLPQLFKTFGDWDKDRLAQAADKAAGTNTYTSIPEHTAAQFRK